MCTEGSSCLFSFVLSSPPLSRLLSFLLSRVVFRLLLSLSSFIFTSLSSLSSCLSLVSSLFCFFVSLCVVVVCVCVLWWCVWFVLLWWCVTLRDTRACIQNASVCTFKTFRVYRHHAHMCFNMCAWCRYTRRRFERTHAGVLNAHTAGPLSLSSLSFFLFPFLS